MHSSSLVAIASGIFILEEEMLANVPATIKIERINGDKLGIIMSIYLQVFHLSEYR
jgi:hypothetical protein